MATSANLQMPRWIVITFGVLSIIAGVLALAWPGITILILVILLGIQLVIYGVLMMTAAFSTGQGRVLAVIFGVLSVLAGTALWLRPLRNLGAVIVVVSVFWVAGGLIQAIGALVERGPDWGWELTAGILSLTAGIVVIAWPGMTLLAVAITVGIWMIVMGLVRIWIGFSRSASRPATT